VLWLLTAQSIDCLLGRVTPYLSAGVIAEAIG
jgi:hypothetical protein